MVQVEPAPAGVPAGIVDLLQAVPVHVVSLHCISLSLVSHLHNPHHYGSQAVVAACTDLKEAVFAGIDMNADEFVDSGLRVAGLVG